MAYKIKLTPEQKRELERNGVVVADMEGCVQHQRRYYNPKDETWTQAIPGDGPRMIRYLRKGFRLQGPDGSLGPPVDSRAVAAQKAAQAMVTPEVPPAPIVEEPKTEQSIAAKKRGMLACPVCGREEEGYQKLMAHMVKHETKAQKKAQKRKKKGG